MRIGTKNRIALNSIISFFEKDELTKLYVDGFWNGYLENKAKLDVYDAFFAELFEEALLSDRVRILKCLRKEKEYQLKIRELWRKYLIRFPHLKTNAEEADHVYNEKLGHILFNPFFEFTYSYKFEDGIVHTDRLRICSNGFNNKFLNIDRQFLNIFIVKNWNVVDPVTFLTLEDEIEDNEIVENELAEIENILQEYQEKQALETLE